jgi:hypothetical protein
MVHSCTACRLLLLAEPVSFFGAVLLALYDGCDKARMQLTSSDALELLTLYVSKTLSALYCMLTVRRFSH